MDSLQSPVGLPRFEVCIDGLPRRQVAGEHAPGASGGSERADEGVDDFEQVCLARSAAPLGRRRGFEDSPLSVGEVEIIRLALGGGGCLGFHVSSLPTI